MMRSWRPRNFAIICWTATTIPATLSFSAAVSSANSPALFSRATRQCNSNSSLTYCGNGLPDYFCCTSSQTTCKQLNNTATPAVICCPNGSDCSSLATISCNTSTQAIPEAPAHMLDLRVSLPTCGSQCCPLGYQCVNDHNNFSCLIKNVTKQAQSSTTNQPTSSASAIASSVSTISISTSAPQRTSPTAVPASSSTSAPGVSSAPSTLQPTERPNKFPAGAVLAGLFPGIILGALLALGILFLLKRRRDRKKGGNRGYNGVFGGPTPSSRGPQISSPIYRPGMSDRTEFMHTRSASGNTLSQPSSMHNVIQASQDLRRTLSSGGTLVPQTQQQGKSPPAFLRPEFETPTRPQRAEQNPVRALFSKSPRLRMSGNMTRATLSRSGASQETIDVLMRPAPPEFGMPLKDTEHDDVSPITPVTTYSDVYRAAGVSPTKAEARARQMDVEFAGIRF